MTRVRNAPLVGMDDQKPIPESRERVWKSGIDGIPNKPEAFWERKNSKGKDLTSCGLGDKEDKGNGIPWLCFGDFNKVIDSRGTVRGSHIRRARLDKASLSLGWGEGIFNERMSTSVQGNADLISGCFFVEVGTHLVTLEKEQRRLKENVVP
ncbi:hypothetical protein ACH5RR_033728 [Cinchona calisaya]|uniref:Uncharacterized protein n=1 Tax=Cinchona calisaya TaxID=153742 RepID=A0ABD2YBS7_9GENT